MVEYNDVRGVIQTINEHLRRQGIGVTIDDDVHETLRAYVEQREMNSYMIQDVARAVAVITWCSIGKVICESLQWAQVSNIRDSMDPFRVYPSDIRQVIAMAHKPENPKDLCIIAVKVIKSSDIADKVLPEAVRQYIESIRHK